MNNVLVNAFEALRRWFNMDYWPDDPHHSETISVNTTPYVRDKRRLLKIKLKSLAAEAAIIRQEEMKLATSRLPSSRELREEIHNHRVSDVREETRATLLAYSFIRGKPYRLIEARSDWDMWDQPGVDSKLKAHWDERIGRIRDMVKKYGAGEPIGFSVMAWIDAEPNRENPPLAAKKPYTGPKAQGEPVHQVSGNEAQ